MKAALKLTRNGNATTICIPRAVLRHMRWKAGDAMILEVTDSDTVSVRPPRVADLRTPGHLRMLESSLPEAAK